MTLRRPSRLNGSSQSMMISVEEPRPLLDEGAYLARCTDATCAWSRRWKKWIVLLVMELLDYDGRPYTGSLCKFLSLGANPKKPHAGQQSQFRKLWVEVNGGQPTSSDVQLGIFVGHVFNITVATVKRNRNGEAVAPAHWYSTVREISFCSTEGLTLEHSTREQSNTRTRQHSNTATQQPANLLTLKETQQHHNTTTHPCPSNGREDSNSRLGSTQHTHNAHPDNTGADGGGNVLFGPGCPTPAARDARRRVTTDVLLCPPRENTALETRQRLALWALHTWFGRGVGPMTKRGGRSRANRTILCLITVTVD